MTTRTLPKTTLAVLPTPLVPAPRLSEAIGIEVWLKRDDLTGLGLGGNKVRALEYLIGGAVAADADCLVTGGGPQSNWVMLAALAAVTAGLEAHISYFGPSVEAEGNLSLVERLRGVSFGFTGDPERSSVDPALDATAERLVAHGHRPYVVGRGGAGPVGAMGYVDAVAEIDHQLADLDIPVVWTATGSCGTQAGLVAGHAVSARRRRVVGVSVHRPVDECRSRISTMARGALDLAGCPHAQPADWDVLGGQLHRDSAANQRVEEAFTLMAETEGIFLDPEFGAPAMAELIASAGELEGPVLFLVTGGAPTLFRGAPSDD